MKYKILFCVFGILILLILSSGIDFAFANTSGSIPAVCDAPSDGTTCSQSGCHNGSPVMPVTGWISSNIPPAGYTPGMVYTITATANYTGINKFGFEISAQTASGNVKGILVNTNTDTQILPGGRYITHTTAGTVGTDSRTWTFNWTAPASGTGQLAFYGAFVCADGNGFSTNDFVYTSVLTVDEAPTPGVDAGIISITYPSVFACDSIISPIVVLQNFGTSTLTSAQINYQIDAGSPNSYSWTGSLATSGTANLTLPSIVLPGAGTHTITVSASNPNGGTDAFTVNDVRTHVFTANFTPVSLPVIEGFENTSFPPAGWRVKNPDNGITWSRVTFARHSGFASAYLHNYGYHSLGQKDELITPSIDLTNSTAPVLHFYMAYRMYGDTAPEAESDTLDIFVSEDCGTTWISVYHNFGFPMATVVPEYNLFQFYPDSTQWRLETIPLSDYVQSNQVLIKFVNTTHYGNGLYLDDISVGDPAGVNLLSAENAFTVYPNPSTGKFTIAMNGANEPVQVQIFNLQGRIISSTNYALVNGPIEFDLGDEAKGMYLVRVINGEKISSKKIILE